MSAQKEITISGVGGQGLIACGTMIAEAAAIHDHKRATLSSEYGVETRGTFAKSDIIVSDEEIYFPDVTDPDLVICLHQVAYERYSGKLGDRALLIYNADEVTPVPERAGREKGLALLSKAREMGNPAVTNILTMGVIVGLLNVITPEAAQESIRRFFAKKNGDVVALNERAFDIGFELGAGLK